MISYWVYLKWSGLICRRPNFEDGPSLAHLTVSPLYVYIKYFLSLSPLAPSLSISKSKPSVAVAVLMDWSFVHKTWEKWASTSVGSSGEPLKAALLINYDPTGPSRLLSTIAEQEGMKADPVDLTEFVDFVKLNKLQTDCFFIGKNQYIVTTIHENWFCARCLNTVKAAGEGAIVMQTKAFLLVALYDGSIGSASRAMASADQLAWQLSRRNL
ncbi:hypothetical protein KPL70_014896 [Citrus sinensis]|nr:hypothetical protein KPL70_014896 [Citrus sinensis]